MDFFFKINDYYLFIYFIFLIYHCSSGGGWIYWPPPCCQAGKPWDCQHASGDGAGWCECTGKARSRMSILKEQDSIFVCHHLLSPSSMKVSAFSWQGNDLIRLCKIARDWTTNLLHGIWFALLSTPDSSCGLVSGQRGLDANHLGRRAQTRQCDQSAAEQRSWRHHQW